MKYIETNLLRSSIRVHNGIRVQRHVDGVIGHDGW